MTFNAAIPGPNDIISQSQAQVQTNFSQIDTVFDINHVTFDNASVADRGKHRRVNFIRVGAPGSSANEAVIYQKLAGGSSNLFMQRDGIATEIQLTGPTPSAGLAGQSTLPGGIILKWGRRLNVASGTVTFATDTSAFPTACFNVWVSLYDGAADNISNSFVYVDPFAINAAGFGFHCVRRISLQSQNSSFTYLAIGN